MLLYRLPKMIAGKLWFTGVWNVEQWESIVTPQAQRCW